MRYQTEERAANPQGFTLIELMITLAIVAIIAAIAYPSYRSSVLKSRRSDAMVALTENAQILERCFTQFASYAADGCPVGATDTVTSPEGYYQVTVAAGTDTFTLKAVPTGKGGQKADDCSQFSLTETGSRGAVNASSTDPVADCW